MFAKHRDNHLLFAIIAGIVYIAVWTLFNIDSSNHAHRKASESDCRSVLFRLKQNSFKTVSKRLRYCFETVLFQFHFVVRTVALRGEAPCSGGQGGEQERKMRG